ncbi:cytochrome P-450 IIC5, putative, partial [Ixodes scapularis]
SVRYLPGNILSFWVAGTNAINRSVIWHMLNCADKPGTVQKAIQDEIDEVVGRERQPAWNDRYRMVYTMAAIWEMLRWRPISPMGLPRGTSEDVIIGGFTIPEGTIVMANLWAVNMDSSLWVHPEKFDPYRFIEEGRAKLKPKPEYFIPFSLGWLFFYTYSLES